MANEEATANYKYDRAIDLIRRIKTEETHERKIDRHKAFDLAISALEKQIPKKPIDIYDENIYQIDDDDYIHESAQFGGCPACNHEVQDGMLFWSFGGQALYWNDTE